MAVQDTSEQEQLRAALVDLQPRLRRFALGLSGSAHDADDLVQAGYERAFSKLEQWQQGTRLDSWMYRIIQNIHFNRLRADGVRRSYVDARRDEPQVTADGAHTAMVQMTLDRVRACVGQLPEEQRACLLLVVVEGLSYKDAAEVMEIPIGTITSRIARARTTLRAMLESEKRP